ncbi:MAG: hypothetical protein EOP77_00230 [Variovorax sp.]|nr:MAG: hypothetical protein EOP77_00230 [Variovorax sp.]
MNTSGDAPTTRPAAEQDPAFTLLEKVPFESAPWQSVNMLRKAGTQIVVVPPGACSFALSGHFAQYLTGRTPLHWPPARYPGNVLFSTYTRHLDRSLRESLFLAVPSAKRIYVRQTPRRFNWKQPMLNVDKIMTEYQPGELSAIIIDTGTCPGRLDEAVVESATVALNTLAETLGCLVLLMVEASSRSIDPFERIPQCLRFLRGTLLAVPLRSKTVVPQLGTPPQFLLMVLPEASAVAPLMRFRLVCSIDMAETSRIEWAQFSYGDPREAFRQAETADLTTAQLKAIRVALTLINERGPMSAEALRSAGPLHGVPSTTMRDALTIAHVLGYLTIGFTWDRRRVWLNPSTPNMYHPLY